MAKTERRDKEGTTWPKAARSGQIWPKFPVTPSPVGLSPHGTQTDPPPPQRVCACYGRHLQCKAPPLPQGCCITSLLLPCFYIYISCWNSMLATGSCAILRAAPPPPPPTRRPPPPHPKAPFFFNKSNLHRLLSSLK